jgi:hypothetical protein
MQGRPTSRGPSLARHTGTEGSDGEKGMGSFEEEGELQARARTRDAVRSLRVHVPTARAWRLQVGQRADPGVRHLRRVQTPAAILTRATSRPWAAQPRQDPRAAADKSVVINGAKNSSLWATGAVSRRRRGGWRSSRQPGWRTRFETPFKSAEKRRISAHDGTGRPAA